MALDPKRNQTPAPPAAKPTPGTPTGTPVGVKPPTTAKKRVPVERPALNFDAIQVTAITNPSTMAKARPAKKDRTAEQKLVDGIVEKAWEAWKTSGRPNRWAKMQGMQLRVPEAQFDTLQYRIRQAGTFLDLKIRFGAVTRKDGYAEVVFVATDRPDPKKSTASQSDESPADAGSSALTPDAALNGTGQTEA